MYVQTRKSEMRFAICYFRMYVLYPTVRYSRCMIEIGTMHFCHFYFPYNYAIFDRHFAAIAIRDGSPIVIGENQ